MVSIFRTIVGVATLGSLKSKVLKGKVSLNDPVRNATYNTFHKVTLDTTLEKLDRILDKEHFALVVHSQRLCKLLEPEKMQTNSN
jgi:cystathionine beta-synthase